MNIAHLGIAVQPTLVRVYGFRMKNSRPAMPETPKPLAHTHNKSVMLQLVSSFRGKPCGLSLKLGTRFADVSNLPSFEKSVPGSTLYETPQGLFESRNLNYRRSILCALGNV